LKTTEKWMSKKASGNLENHTEVNRRQRSKFAVRNERNLEGCRKFKVNS
jgi:hypothetical protein